MKQHPLSYFLADINATVARALREDLLSDSGERDVSAALIPTSRMATATIITRERAVIAGAPWVNETLRQCDAQLRIQWKVVEGEHVEPEQTLFELAGPAHSMLTAERTCLNFLQLLSGTATISAEYCALLAPFKTRLLDTRKTLPGLRLAQKYAVRIGGGTNHRVGLFDAFLIKENHIAAAGSIASAVSAARAAHAALPVEVEVETLEQLQQALRAGADIVMLDNFSNDDMRTAVRQCAGRALLEASGGIERAALVDVARTGVDFISVGSLTKHVRAVDLSMRLTLTNDA